MFNEEEEFWKKLRIEIIELELTNSYCDWIEPKVYYLAFPQIIIEGKIGFLNPEMEVLDFILTIPNQNEDLQEIVWKDFVHLEIQNTVIEANRFRIDLMSKNTSEINK